MHRRVTRAGAIGIFALLVGAAQPARAGDTGVSAEAGVAVYADGDKTSVVTPHAQAAYDHSSGASVRAQWTADVISSASIDVVTAATGRFRDLRQEVAIGGGYDRRHKGLDGSYAFSWENDTRAHTASVGAHATWFDNLEMQLRYSFNLTSLGRVTQAPSEWRDMMVHGFDVSALHPLGKRGTAELIVSGYYVTGYQANPYRKVPVTATGTFTDALWFDEAVPERRFRFAATARVRHALGSRLLGSAEYRFYRDTWGLMAHTAELRLAVDVWAGLTLELRDRFHIQGASDLYREVYTEPRVYMTRDRRQSAFLANTGGVAAAYVWHQRRVSRLAVRASLDLLTSDFEHYLYETNGGLKPYGWVSALLGNVALDGEF